MQRCLMIVVLLGVTGAAIAGPTTADTNTYIYTDNGGTDHLWSYGFDSSKYINGETGYSRYACEIARDPVLLTSGPYAGGYEYLFDLYLFDGYGATGTTYEIGGLDNSKILNKETLVGGVSYPNGRVMQFWSWGSNADVTRAQEIYGPSYDDGAGGWDDTGLGYPYTFTGNPHAYGDYVRTTGYFNERYAWYIPLELVDQGGSFSYQYSGVTNAVSDQIVISRYWQGVASGANGLIFTLRVVYEDPIIPTYMGGTDDLWWSFANYGAGTRYNILGEFDLFALPGDFDDDGDVDADDIDELCDNMGSLDPQYDLDDGSGTGTPDGVVDENDMIYHIEELVELTDGVRVGTKRGDFNLDGLIDGTDLALMKTAFGQPLMDYADGNAN
ncbi:hypothetical protein LCGC14_0467770, partial [marine sediment metagenome]